MSQALFAFGALILGAFGLLWAMRRKGPSVELAKAAGLELVRDTDKAANERNAAVEATALENQTNAEEKAVENAKVQANVTKLSDYLNSRGKQR